jgi:formylglycine-generating enzyme required for sulfatase activity
MPLLEQMDQSKAKVFISYSRKDIAFADRLDAALKARGFEPLIDRSDIYAFEEWWKRVEALIGQSDTVVFVLSPDAVRPGTVALKEVAFAASLNKRFAPIVFRPFEDKSVPEALAKLNFIFFDDASQFEQSTDKLAEALNTDIGWIRQHTEYGEAERRWSAANHPKGLLLHSPALEVAEHWIVSRPRDAPEPTKEIQAFVGASRQGARVAQRLWRLVMASMFTLLVGIIAGLVGWINQEYLKGLYHWFFHVRDSVLTAHDERMLKPGQAFSECVKTDGDYSKYCPEMIVVPAGKFMMGSPSTEEDRAEVEGPQHEVTIARPFAVSKFEVTFGQWETCIQYGGCAHIGNEFGGGKQPAINISWYDAKKYVDWLSKVTGNPYRLLIEAEWEYAARARSTGPYSFEGDASILGEYAWYGENSHGETHPVGEKKPNAFGLYDMQGNVFEWVEDCAAGYAGSPSDGTAWTGADCGERIIRGGSWVNGPELLRSASRNSARVVATVMFLGFRVARTLLPP